MLNIIFYHISLSVTKTCGPGYLHTHTHTHTYTYWCSHSLWGPAVFAVWCYFIFSYSSDNWKSEWTAENGLRADGYPTQASPDSCTGEGLGLVNTWPERSKNNVHSNKTIKNECHFIKCQTQCISPASSHFFHLEPFNSNPGVFIYNNNSLHTSYFF